MNEQVPVLVETGAGFTVLFRGSPLYPPEDPMESARRKACAAALAADTLYLIPSPLLGYGLEVLLERLPASSALLCAEREAGLAGLFRASQLSTRLAPPAGLFVAGDSPAKALQAAARLGIHRFRRVVLLALNRGFQLHRSFYEGLRDELLELVQNHWRNRMTILNLGRLWVKNLLLNLPLLGSAGDAGRLPIDRPVLLFGAGESLEAVLPLAARLRGRLFVAAVDTALPALSKAGLVPDLVFAADSQWANLGDFVGSAGAGYALAADMTAYPPILRGHPGRLYLFLSRFYELGLLDRLSENGLAPHSIPPLGSVGVMAYRLLRQSYRGPLFLAGLDFHYGRAKTHARGTPSHDRLLRTCARLAPAAYQSAALGRPVTQHGLADGTSGAVDAVLLEYNRQFCRLAAGDGRLFDLSGSGLARPIPRVPLERVENIMAGHDLDAAARMGREPRPSPSGRRIDGFLAALENELVETIALLGAGTALSVASRALLAMRLEELDFLYFDFPDFPPPPRPEGRSIGRLFANAHWYLDKVRRARLVNPRRS